MYCISYKRLWARNYCNLFWGVVDIAQIFMEKKLVWLYFYSPKRFVSFNASLALLFAFFCCCCSRRNRVYIAILVIMSVCCSLVNGFWQGDVERLSIGKKVKQWMFDQVVIYNNNDNSDPSHPTLDIVHLR